ncbi:DNA-directed RNA polymerase alpha subunit [Bradyrhizobium japonicum]
MSRRMFAQIKETLAESGLHLGMKVSNWPTERLAAIVLKAGVFFERVDEMPLSVRSANCLKNANIDYVGQLVQKTDELLRTPNFGRSSLNEVREMLSGMELQLGMDLSGWPGSTDTLSDAGP